MLICGMKLNEFKKKFEKDFCFLHFNIAYYCHYFLIDRIQSYGYVGI